MGQPLEYYVEHVDELAQQVVNVWGPFAEAGHQHKLRPEFMALFDKACRYRTARAAAQNHREFNVLTAEDEAEEKETRLAFAEAYKALEDSAGGIEPLSRGVGG